MLDPLVAAVGSRIRELRLGRGLSQEQLAEAAQLTLETVSRTERGASEISITSLSRICEAIGTSLAGFFGKARLPGTEPDLGTNVVRQVAAMLEGCDPREARRVLAIVRLVVAGVPKRGRSAEPRSPSRRRRRSRSARAT